ncbi:TonB-dependent receptor [Flavivirga spongiicola]|uniref:TonB-dependent receptor n=1 Tax=Flavivirga spongiicola TaxID=421621 RepID=A0ABU7XNG2_9FLAO|nr:TonB-dependent receptor [Flavivirga sp. MEBiC05379]MDO5977305.1 TonB-dependent receptor [Flavivirga sp. MEBiC05379]
MNKIVNLNLNKEIKTLRYYLLTIMRIFLLLITIGLSSAFANSSYSQTKINIDVNDVTLEDLFKEIQNKSEFVFFYKDNTLNNEVKISLNLKRVTLSTILYKAFSETDLSYKIDNRQVVVIKNSEPTIVKEELNDQQSSISGIIVDAQGVPLPGVNIVKVGTSTGAQTDFDGKYSINATKGDVLEFSYIGMVTQRITVGDSNLVNVTMKDDISQLDEVVLVGYGTRKVSKVSGSVSTISTKVLENRTIRSIGEALQGTAANLNVTIADGRATSVPNINIRGFESINGGSPLIIIDGVSATASELARLNPSDVEAISVLKDASTAAIYGARASFGVLLIKTKEGKGKLRVDYNENVSFRQPTFLPEIELNPEIVFRSKHDAAFPYYNLYNDAIYDYAAQVAAGQAPPVFLDETNQRFWQYYGSTDWFKEAYKTNALSINRNVSVSGKNEKTSYYFSLGSLREDGAIKFGTDKFNRYNLRSKVSFDFTDWLTIGNNTAWESSKYDEPSGWNRDRYFHDLNRTPSTEVIYNPDGSFTRAGAGLIGITQDGGRRKEVENTFSTQLTAQLSLIKDIWKVNADYTVKKGYGNTSNFRKPVFYKTGPNEPLQPFYGQSNVTSASRSNYETTYKAINLYTTVTKELNKHYISGVVGFNQEEKVSKSFYASRENLISTSLPTLALATGDFDAGAGFGDWAVRGAFGRLEYSFDDKYIVKLVGRYDGSSRFPKKDRFGFFPSASAAWRIDKEPFMQNQSVISLLKPRVSWGSLGNQSGDTVGNYPYISSMGSGTINQLLDGVQPDAIYQPGLVAGSLTWETVETKNLGIDVEFFRGKIFAQFDIYERETKDMLTKSKTLPAVLGAREPNENAADLINRGWGLTVKWNESVKLGKSPLNFSLGFNLSDSRAWITKFDNPDSNINDFYIGQEMGEIWGLTSDGIFQTVEEVQNAPFADHRASDEVRYMAVGDVKWKDLDGDGIINFGSQRVGDTGDFRVIGNETARYRYGINLSANWNNFDFRIFGQGVGQRDYYASRGSHYFWGIFAQPWANPSKHILDNLWSPENPGGLFPRLKAYAAEDFSELGIPQTRFLINAGYFRVKNVTLGYSLPASLLDKLNIKRLRVYVSGENLLTFSDITKFGMDPETLDGRGAYPVQKKFSFGVNLGF